MPKIKFVVELLQTVIIPAIAITLLALFAAAAIHELGHALAVLLVGFRLKAISVWPFCLTRSTSSWTLTWSASNPSYAKKLGSVIYSPTGTQSRRVRLIITTLAGPFASAAAFTICALVHHFLTLQIDLAIFFDALGIFSLTALLTTTLPLSKGRKNDGRRAYDLLRAKGSLE